LLKLNDGKVKAAAFVKATALKAEAKELLPQVEDGIKNIDPAVQSAALKLAVAILVS
jgi:hypothetical protein